MGTVLALDPKDLERLHSGLISPDSENDFSGLHGLAKLQAQAYYAAMKAVRGNDTYAKVSTFTY